MQKSDFLYDLPEHRIATHRFPSGTRKLLVFDGNVSDHNFTCTLAFLEAN